jgi:hypothetical protein
MLLFPGPRSWLQDGCSSVSSQKNRDERASRSWGTNARTEAIPWLYISQRRPRKRGGGHKKKIQREPNLHITIGFIFLQYQPPETEATEQEKHKNKRGKNAEKNQGTTGEANETETERSIGQPTHEHQPCLGLRRSLNRRTTSRERA